MARQIAGLHSRDPLDHQRWIGDPLDHANANARFASLDVRALRKRLHMTQERFARLFGFSLATLRHWERGNRRPTGTAVVLLNVIRENPRVVLLAVRKTPPRTPARTRRAPPGFGERKPPLRPRGKRRAPY